MIYRQFKVAATGQWLEPLFSADGDTYDTPMASHIQDLAAQLGVELVELEGVDSNEDLRTGELLALPPDAILSDADRLERILVLQAQGSLTYPETRELSRLVTEQTS